MSKFITIFLFSILIMYQVVGVTIHKQYGFGIFYWPIQESLLLLVSVFFLLTNLNRVSKLFKPKFILYHMYFLIIILFLFNYFVFYNYNQVEIVIINTINFYLISLALVLNFNSLVILVSLKRILWVYFVVIISFFIFTFNIQSDIFMALTIGPNFPHQIKDSLPGYTWGFHLFFSPFFVALTFFVLNKIKEENKPILLYFTSFISLYILLLAGGRGTLLSFAVILFIFTIQLKTLSILVFISCYLLIATFFADFFIENQRMYQILTFNFDDDASGQGRSKVLFDNIEFIRENFLVGGYLEYVNGHYIHNILSILQDFGFLPFLIIIAIIIHGIYICLFKVKNNESDKSLLIAKNIFLFEVLDHCLFKYSTNFSSLLLLFVSYNYLILMYTENYLKSLKLFKRSSYV